MLKKNYFFILICIFIAYIFSGCTKAKLLTAAGEKLEPVTEQSEKCAVEDPRNEPYLFYKFTDKQKELIKDMQCEKSGASFGIKISGPGDESRFSFGFLYKEDFKSGSKIVTPLSSRCQVRGKYSDVKADKFSLQLCIKRTDEPEGFYFYSAGKADLLDSWIEPYKIGIEFLPEPLFSYGIDGGTVSSEIYSVDFSRAEKTLPEGMKITLTLNTKETAAAKNEDRIVFENRGEVFTVRLSGKDSFDFDSRCFKNGTGVFKFTGGNKFVKSFTAVWCKEDEAIAADIGMILDWPEKNWRQKDYELFRWSIFPDVLFFDFKDYQIQDSFLTRLAYFVEKTGYKGTFVDDDFILNNHGYNAHDYKAKDLANFFTQALRHSVQLNENELLLRSILIRNGIIVTLPDGTFEEGTGCIISISRESSPSLRNQLVAHECWHGIYFMDSGFRDYVKSLYGSFNPDSLSFLKSYWATAKGLGYDLNDDYLMKNEFMAYHLQLSPQTTGAYFVTRSYWSNMRSFPDLQRYVQQTKGKDFEMVAYSLSDYVYERWGLYGGRTFLVFRESPE
ncbi:hypothetical protein DYE49_07995 [Treponema rectale]|uniref:Uncharacterized protein n=1 Tax=Treponema rectale TaxID=744512 RepID=A0A840SCI2_9SPIR|nr:hypothetical protein [Treponema rectale]MBB5217878.1 hypothetical protein [Treponema rectale]QOS40398.1 hypothetical protein DYE49_07995 [Treponema rectale]